MSPRKKTPVRLFQEFFKSERTGGILLIICTVLSLLLANSAWADSYLHFWHVSAGPKPIEFWVNDAAMTIFFLLVGLEIKREFIQGELSQKEQALLPVIAALGGMLIPAGIHFFLNKNTATASGYGIPMATDIAFSLAILSLLGNKIPNSLKVFLTALAIIDDLGAIIVIAVFYTAHLNWLYLGAALGILIVLWMMNRMRVKFLAIYLLPGMVLWYLFYRSGIHATISGVLLALVIPYGSEPSNSPSHKLQHLLHGPVAFFILPLFALCNTAIQIPSNWHQELLSTNSLGIMAGLVVGKPLGILLAILLAVKFGWCKFQQGINWSTLTGAGMLAGIGFTMSIFISLLAFQDQELIISSKMAVMAASLVSGIAGYSWLKRKI